MMTDVERDRENECQLEGGEKHPTIQLFTKSWFSAGAPLLAAGTPVSSRTVVTELERLLHLLVGT